MARFAAGCPSVMASSCEGQAIAAAILFLDHALKAPLDELEFFRRCIANLDGEKSDQADYRWYIDPLAKKRHIPSAKLRGPTRASHP